MHPTKRAARVAGFLYLLVVLAGPFVLINFDRKGLLVSEVFWGLWLLPLGWLVYRSGFLPRFLGVWLLLNGLAYLAISSTGLLLPQHLERVSTIATPVLFGEVALMLWLLIMGVRVQPSAVTAEVQRQ